MVLHIGAMKTGTTFVQQLLVEHRAALAEHGCHVPREPALSLRGILSGAPMAGAPTRRDRVAHRFLNGLQEHAEDRSVVSWEFLSFLDEVHAARVVTALGGDVDVVLTVRDAARTLPAQWQTTCRNGGTVPWRRFVRDIGGFLDEGRTSRSARVFQRTQDIPRMLGTWSAVVGPERIRVVTVPRSAGDPMLLWRRFATAAGIEAGVASRPAGPRNPSLGHPSCELLRRINQRFGGDLPRGPANIVRAVVAPDLEARAGSERPVVLDEYGRDLAARWNQRVRDAVVASGAELVGDLADLPIEPAADDRTPKRPQPDELLAAAATARAALVELGGTPAPGEPAGVDAAVDELVAMLRALARVNLNEAKRARGRGRR